jgi:transcriptional regulator with XRE-family HTH domain
VTAELSEVLGATLRARRRELGLTLADVEARTGGEFKASVVGAYERGERAVSVPRLMGLAELYGMPARGLLPDSMTEELAMGLEREQVIDDGDPLGAARGVVVSALVGLLALAASAGVWWWVS